MRTIFLFMFLLSLTASGVYAAASPVTGEQNLLIFYSNDVLGEIEPCG